MLGAALVCVCVSAATTLTTIQHPKLGGLAVPPISLAHSFQPSTCDPSCLPSFLGLGANPAASQSEYGWEGFWHRGGVPVHLFAGRKGGYIYKNVFIVLDLSGLTF